MTNHKDTPHFHNSMGIETIQVGAKRFQCMGALPPFDHPHIFLDMGEKKQLVCPYCSTVYLYDKDLAHGHANPSECLYAPISSAE